MVECLFDSPLPIPRVLSELGRDSTTNLLRIEPRNRIPLTPPLPRWGGESALRGQAHWNFLVPASGERRSHSNVAVRLRYFLSPAAGERIKVRGRGKFMGNLHSFLARIGTMNLPHVRFVVERFRADFRVWRNSATTALKRSTTNHARFGCGSANPRFMERGDLRAWARHP